MKELKELPEDHGEMLEQTTSYYDAKTGTAYVVVNDGEKEHIFSGTKEDEESRPVGDGTDLPGEEEVQEPGGDTTSDPSSPEGQGIEPEAESLPVSVL